MLKKRVPETDHGIEGGVIVTTYDEMQRYHRDRGWIETQAIIKSGIRKGQVLEIGHGPGYLGLEWLKNTADTCMVGVDISPEMTALATKNAKAYGLENRVSYHKGCGNALPFEGATFDAVFTNGSLHEWTEPEETFNEIFRVLKPGGRYFICDLRRDMPIFMRLFLWLATRPTSIRPFLISSINAAYTLQELQKMVSTTDLNGAHLKINSIDVYITGQKHCLQ